MLWRFSFASTSTVDALLSRETPPSIEELMDEQDILSECKAQNNKLVTYLSREDACKSLLQWVVSGIDDLDEQAIRADAASHHHAISQPGLYPPYQLVDRVPDPRPGSPPLEPAKMNDQALNSSPNLSVSVGLGQQGIRDSESQQSKYPQIATEILTSEVWTIPETIMGHKDLLRPFWDAVLPPVETGAVSLPLHEKSERERARDYFWSDDDEERRRRQELVRGMWMRVNGALVAKRTTEMIRFIQSLPNIVERILAQISSPAVQDMVIRIVSSEEAGVSGVVEWLSNEHLVPRLIALLSPNQSPNMHSIASELLKSIITLCAPSPFNPAGGNAAEQQAGQGIQPPGARDNRLIRELVSETSIQTMVGYLLDPLELSDRDWKGLDEEKSSPADPFIVHPLPSIASVTSSLSNICNVLVELIRRNNSDFSEPHLFHTLRNRLMLVRSLQQSGTEDEERKRMEEAMTEMSEKMGIVHLGNLLTALSDRFEQLNRLLLEPRSQQRAASALRPTPLTLERFRIVELYAELLHSSNMSILNRTTGLGPSYTADGILDGGLAGLEALGEAIEGDRVGEEDAPEGQVTQARDFPVSSGSTEPSLGSEADEDMLQEIEDDLTPSQSPAASMTLPPPETISPPSQADVARLRDVMGIGHPDSSADSESPLAVAATAAAPSETSQQEVDSPPRAMQVLAPGDRLKQMYIQHQVLPTVVNLFFEMPNNDFMHHVVYDVLQQILNGRLGPGINRELVIGLIRDAKLVERILDAQRLNDRMIAQPKTPRLAYMGHVVLIAEEIVKFLSRCPPELHEVIKDSYVQSEWDAFVEGSLQETKARDARPLAGGKPMQPQGSEGPAGKSEDSGSDDDDEAEGAKFGEPLTRTVASNGYVQRSGFDTHGEKQDTGDEEHDQFWPTSSGPRRSIDSSDEEDDDADWLRPSASGAQRESEEDEFGSYQTTQATQTDEFEDDDAWGNFATASPVGTPNDDPENPFGDDNFAPTVVPAQMGRQDPLTPHDWASEFDREFESDVPAIVVPNLGEDEDDERDPTTPGSTWSFSADGDGGEDLPPTTSPIIDGPGSPRTERDLGQAMYGLGIGDPQAGPSRLPHHSPSQLQSPQLPPSPSGPVPDRSMQSPVAPVTIPARRLSLSASISLETGEAISPPDSSLVMASSPDEPLGPGVSRDTHINTGGMLEKEVDGETIQVPADEIVRGVEEAMERRVDEGER